MIVFFAARTARGKELPFNLVAENSSLALLTGHSSAIEIRYVRSTLGVFVSPMQEDEMIKKRVHEPNFGDKLCI